MRVWVVLVFSVAAFTLGCKKPSTPAVAPAINSSNTVQGPPPREVKPEAASTVTAERPKVNPLPKVPIGGIFKPIPQRTTDELLEEVQHFSTKDHLPLLAELAKRSKDKNVVIAKMGMLQTDGRYHVRLTAANVAVALDAENPGKHATTLSVAFNSKVQNPTYGPVIESSPELRGIQKAIVPQLVKVLEKELAEAKLYEQTLGALTILGTFPKEIGEPAVGTVRKVATTPMHPTALFAKDTLKKWGVE